MASITNSFKCAELRIHKNGSDTNLEIFFDKVDELTQFFNVLDSSNVSVKVSMFCHGTSGAHSSNGHGQQSAVVKIPLQKISNIAIQEPMTRSPPANSELYDDSTSSDSDDDDDDNGNAIDETTMPKSESNQATESLRGDGVPVTAKTENSGANNQSRPTKKRKIPKAERDMTSSDSDDDYDYNNGNAIDETIMPNSSTNQATESSELLRGDDVRVTVKIENSGANNQSRMAKKWIIPKSKYGRGHSDVKCPRTRCREFFESTEGMMYHKIFCHEGSKYECHLCKKGIRSKSTIKIHMNEVHRHRTPYQCRIRNCSKTFPNKSALAYHMSSHTEDKKIECTHCAEIFYKRCDLKIHLAVAHGIGTIHRCAECGAIFSSKAYLQQHIRFRHMPQMFKCSIASCGKSYSTNGHLERHIDAKHTKKTLFKCTKCFFSSPYKSSLVCHMKRVHSSERGGLANEFQY